jgi:ABC-type multidrug transport system fused ATPase/permease subunit
MYLIEIWLDFLKKNPYLCLASLILMLSIPINDIALPHVYSKFIESLQKNDENNSKKIAVVIVCLLVFLQFLSVYGDVFDGKFIPKFQGHLSLQMVKKILDKYDKNYSDLSTGSIIARFSKVPELFLYWLSSFKNYIIPYAISFFGIFCYFFYYDRVIGLSFLIAIISILLILHYALASCNDIASQSASSESNLYNEMEDVLNNILPIFSNNKKGEEMNRLEKIRGVYEDLYRKTTLCGTKSKILSFVVLIVFFIIFIYRCIYLVKNKKLDSARVVAMFMMFTTVFSSLVWCVGITRDIIKDYSIMLETDGFVFDPDKGVKNTLPENPPNSGIGLHNINFTYPNTERQILKDLSINIKPGERVVITGENGMGKSTVMKILMGFYKPNTGGGYVDGKWYDSYTKEELRKKIGYIPQNTGLFNRSIMENLRYGNENYTEEEIKKFIDNLGIKNELGDLDRNAGKNGNNLSGGQRGLVWMIRILLKNPDYIILDEPTNSLDQNTKELLLKLLDSIDKNQTVIAISHDPFFTNYFDRKIVIDKGHVV